MVLLAATAFRSARTLFFGSLMESLTLLSSLMLPLQGGSA